METPSHTKTRSSFLINQTSPSTPPQITKDSFQFLYITGEGSISKVWKVQHKKTHLYLAIKETPKLYIINQKYLQSLFSEKEILSTLNKNPFISQMYSSFQDKSSLYLVLDYYSGGDLRYYSQHHKKLTELQLKFLVANITLGLEYIHSKGIIHRNLTPENIICDDKGYFHICGFSLAKKIGNKVLVGKDIFGPPGYTAPETVIQETSSYESDYFSLGVIIYELLFNKLPYQSQSSKTKMKEEFQSKHIMLLPEDIPKGFHRNELSDFINGLLCIDKDKRLGSEGSSQIKMHNWLKGFNWNGLKYQKVISDFLPKTGGYYVRQIKKDENGNKKKAFKQDMLDDIIFQKQFEHYDYIKRSIKEDGLKRLLTMRDAISLTEKYIIAKRFKSSKSIANKYYVNTTNKINLSESNNDYIRKSITARNYSQDKKQINTLMSTPLSNKSKQMNTINNSNFKKKNMFIRGNVMSLRKNLNSSKGKEMKMHLYGNSDVKGRNNREERKVLPKIVSPFGKEDSFIKEMSHNEGGVSGRKRRMVLKMKLNSVNNTYNNSNFENSDIQNRRYNSNKK